MKPSSIRSRHPHPAIKWTLLMSFVVIFVLGIPGKVAASMPTVKPPTGPSTNGYFTGTYTFETYINCSSGLSFQSSYSNSLEGTHTFNFDGASDGSLLVRIDGGGDLILYSCGNPTPSSLIVTYTVSRDTSPPSVSISSPANGSSTSNSQINVAVSASDSTSGIGSVTVNGQAASYSGGLWQVVIGVNVGSNSITTTATDKAGNASSAQITVTRTAVVSPTPTPLPPSGTQTTPAPSSSPKPVVNSSQTQSNSYSTPVPTQSATPAPATAVTTPATSHPVISPTVAPDIPPSGFIQKSHPPKHQSFALSVYVRGLTTLLLVSIIILVLARTTARSVIFNALSRMRIHTTPYVQRLKRALRGRAHNEPKGRRFSHASHTGKLVAHHHTSYPALVFLILTAAVFSGAVAFSGHAESSNLSLTVLGPPPTVAATINSPLDGTTVTNQNLQVKGTCPLGLVVEIYRDGGFAGSSYCDASGNFSLVISLLPGTSILVARDLDGLGQYGPDSNTVSVTYTPPPPPPTPLPPPPAPTTPLPTLSPAPNSSPQSSPTVTPVRRPLSTPPKTPIPLPFILDSDQHYVSGVAPGDKINWQLKIVGGTAPFEVIWNWGDGSRDDTRIVDRQITSPPHSYQRPGFYKVTVTAKDASGRTALIQMLAVVNGAPLPGAVTPTPDFGRLLPVWPLLGAMMLLVVSFWLGERDFKAHHGQPLPQA